MNCFFKSRAAQSSFEIGKDYNCSLMETNCVENFWTPIIYLKMWQLFTFFGCICVISVLTLLSNSAVILSIFRTSQDNNVFCKLVLFLSISDCSLAVTYQMFASIVIFKPENSCVFQITAQFFVALFFYLSGYIIIAIAVERMININSLQPNIQNLPLKRPYLICLICVLLAFLTDLLHTIFTVNGMFSSFEFVILTVDIIGLVLIFSSYMAVYRKVRAHIRGTVILRNRGISEKIPTPESLSGSNTAKVIKRILTAVCIAYVPYAVLYLSLKYGLNTENLKNINWVSAGKYFTYVPMYFNSTVDAVIFVTGNKKCKRFLKRILWNARVNDQ